MDELEQLIARLDEIEPPASPPMQDESDFNQLRDVVRTHFLMMRSDPQAQAPGVPLAPRLARNAQSAHIAVATRRREEAQWALDAFRGTSMRAREVDSVESAPFEEFRANSMEEAVRAATFERLRLRGGARENVRIVVALSDGTLLTFQLTHAGAQASNTGAITRTDFSLVRQ